MEEIIESTNGPRQAWTTRTLCLQEAGKNFQLLAERHPEWPTFGAFCAAYESTNPFSHSKNSCAIARSQLKEIAERARSEAVALQARPGRLFVACITGLTRLAKSQPTDDIPRFTAQYFISLACLEPLLLEDAAYHPWRGRTQLALTTFPVQLEVGEIQAMLDAAGPKFCERIQRDYAEEGFGLGCNFPALARRGRQASSDVTLG